MTERGRTPVGLTKDAGWEIGVSRTVRASPAAVWRFLTSETGLGIWLGEGVAPLPTERGAEVRAADGSSGELRSYRAHDRIRLTWQPPQAAESTVQVALTGGEDKTTLRFHQERLADAEEREAQREHWRRVLDRLVEEAGW